VSPIAIIEMVATLLWCYAGVSFIVWVGHLRRSDKRRHIPHVTDLIANLVPAMIALVAVVIAGAMLGFPTVVVVIAVLFPAGLAFGVHMSLNDIREDTTARAELLRIGLAFAIGAAVIFWRQFR